MDGEIDKEERKGPPPPPVETRFKPGESGNPGGRRRSLTKLIREKTRDGKTIVDFMVKVMEGDLKGARVSDRVAAAKFLAEHAFGKPEQHVDLSGEVTAKVELVEAIRQARTRLGRAVADASGGGGGEDPHES